MTDLSRTPTRTSAAWLPLLARLAPASPFLISGAVDSADFAGATAEVRRLSGLEPEWLFAVLVIATQLVGSLPFLFAGRRAWIGAGLLAGSTALATLLAHAWRKKPRTEAPRDLAVLCKHVSVCGGLMLAGWRSGRESAACVTRSLRAGVVKVNKRSEPSSSWPSSIRAKHQYRLA